MRPVSDGQQNFPDPLCRRLGCRAGYAVLSKQLPHHIAGNVLCPGKDRWTLQ